MQVKLCKKCGVEKPVDEMARQGKLILGKCKRCAADYVAARSKSFDPEVLRLRRLQKINLDAARQAGEKFFISVLPCPKGHLGLKTVSTQSCCECQKEKSLARYDRGDAYARKLSGFKRKIALQLGRTHYSTGIPCKNGHQANRLVSTRQCVECLAGRAPKRAKPLSEEASRRINAMRRSKAGRIRQRRYYKEVLSKCELHRIRSFMRACIRRCLIGKTGSTVELLGYTEKELRASLETKFKAGMSWANYGAWHIDHEVPIKTFIELDCYDPAIINCLTNLQPLWAKENLSKGSIFL